MVGAEVHNSTVFITVELAADSYFKAIKQIRQHYIRFREFNVVLISIAVACFGYRFYRVASEGNTNVFNIVRNDLKNGTPVETLIATQTKGVLYEPITIKNNRGYVSGVRVKLFYNGQNMGDCKIVSVSKDIDLDSGMHVIKTSKCKDGLKYAENIKTGFLVPTSSVRGNTVYVADAGVARMRNVEIDGHDAQNVLIKSGINDGDVIILSDIKDGQKIKIVK